MKIKNKPFWIGVIIGIIILVVLPIAINLNKPKPSPPIYYIATDDITYSDCGLRPANESFLIGGRYKNDVGCSAITYAYLQFDLRNRPNNWILCEFSFYVFENEDSEGQAVWFGFVYHPEEWNETSITYIPSSWRSPDYVITIEERHGLHKYNITTAMRLLENDSYYESNEKITIGVWGRNDPQYNPNYIMFYSKEANVSTDMKPQLIWS